MKDRQSSNGLTRLQLIKLRKATGLANVTILRAYGGGAVRDGTIVRLAEAARDLGYPLPPAADAAVATKEA